MHQASSFVQASRKHKRNDIAKTHPLGMLATVVEGFSPGVSVSDRRSLVKGHYNGVSGGALRFPIPIDDEGSALDVHHVLHKLLHERAVPGKADFVKGSALEWPLANLLAGDYVRVIGGDESPTPECVVVSNVVIMFKHRVVFFSMCHCKRLIITVC